MTEDLDKSIDHLDFDTEDRELKMALEASARILKDPRDYQEALDDELDSRIYDILHAIGAVEAEDDTTFSREAITEVARQAYFKGMRDDIEHPEVIEGIMKAINKNGPGLKTLDKSAQE
jgi:hypothetical protein